jgi:uncharacterized protein involved in cysteine biosynthesis
MMGDVARALADLRDRRLWGVAAAAVALTLALLAAVFTAAAWALGVGSDLSFTLPWIGVVEIGGGATGALWTLAALVASLFLTPPVAALFIGMMLDWVVDAVESRNYRGLPPARPVPWLRQMGAAANLLGLMILANLAGLVLWILLPPAAPFVFLAINGWLIGREYFELVAYRRVDPATARALRKKNGLTTTALGAAIAAALAIPVLNLLAPLLGVAAITHMFHRVAPGR